MTHADIPTLDPAGLRKFGLTTGAIFVAIFWFALPWLRSHPAPVWPWVVAGVLAVPALVAPTALRPVHRGWMRFGHVMGAINGRIILGIFFFFLVVPAALWFRVTGKDLLGRRYLPNATSYRVPSKQRPARSMENPF